MASKSVNYQENQQCRILPLYNAHPVRLLIIGGQLSGYNCTCYQLQIMPRFFKVLAVQSSQRTLEEMINSILVTKMYSWESFALSKVSSKRRKECALYQNRAMWAGFSMALLRFTPHILVAVTFLTSLMTNQIGTFRASSVFTTLSFANTTILYIRSVGKLELLQILYACFFQTVVRDNPKQKNGRPV